MNRLISLLLTAVLAVAGLLTSPLNAQADPLPSETWTAPLDGPDYPYINVRTGPGLEHDVATTISSGTDFLIGCWTTGAPVTGPYGTSEIWYSTPNDGPGWVTDAVIWTGSNDPVTAQCDAVAVEQPAAPRVYSPLNAAAWARDHAFDTPLFEAGDCTWFVSQALWAGGLPRTADWTHDSEDPDKTTRGFHPGPTPAARLADKLFYYLIDNEIGQVEKIEWSDNTAGGAEIGDLIFYDLQIYGKYDIDHAAIVTGFNADGYPLVTQHTNAALDKFWSWSDGYGDWIEYAYPGSVAYLIKITA
jgi:hypothetical protein